MNNKKKEKKGGCNACAKARAARLAKIKADQKEKELANKKVSNTKVNKKTEEKKMETINEEPCQYCDEIKE